MIGTQHEEPHQQRGEQAETDVRGQPADVAQRELAVQEEPEEPAVEGDQAGGEPARTPAPDVHRRGHQDDEENQRRDAVGAQRQAGSHGTQDRERQDQRRHELLLRRGVVDGEPGHHRDDAADEHRHDQQGVIRRADDWPAGRRRRAAAARRSAGRIRRPGRPRRRCPGSPGRRCAAGLRPGSAPASRSTAAWTHRRSDRSAGGSRKASSLSPGSRAGRLNQDLDTRSMYPCQERPDRRTGGGRPFCVTGRGTTCRHAVLPSRRSPDDGSEH